MRIKARDVQCGDIVLFASGKKALVGSKFGTGDGTVSLGFQRGDKVWSRRVRDNVRLSVVSRGNVVPEHDMSPSPVIEDLARGWAVASGYRRA